MGWYPSAVLCTVDQKQETLQVRVRVCTCVGIDWEVGRQRRRPSLTEIQDAWKLRREHDLKLMPLRKKSNKRRQGRRSRKEERGKTGFGQRDSSSAGCEYQYGTILIDKSKTVEAEPQMNVGRSRLIRRVKHKHVDNTANNVNYASMQEQKVKSRWTFMKCIFRGNGVGCHVTISSDMRETI